MARVLAVPIALMTGAPPLLADAQRWRPVQGSIVPADPDVARAARLAASGLANEAWRRLRAGDHDGAAERLGAAWRADPSYFDVYWGLATLLQMREEIDGAIAMLEHATGLPGIDARNEAPLLGDLANLYAIKAWRLSIDAPERSMLFARADAIFAIATRIDPAHPQPWIQWVVDLLYQERYADAWATVDAARRRGHRVPEEVLVPLRRRADEPMP